MANKQRAARPAQNDSSLLGTAAVSGSGTEASTSTGADAATSTGPDAGTGAEVGTSTGADAVTSTGPDAGTGTEVGTSTGADAGTNTGPDAGTDTGTDDAAPSVDGGVRVRLLCTNHLGQIGDIVTVPTGHVDALRGGGLADPHPAALEAGE